MRCNVRLFIAIATALLLTLLFLGGKHRDDIRALLQTTSSDSKTPPTDETSTPQTTPGDKIIVMAKLTRENTDWVAQHLPDWQNAIYTVDAPPTTTTTRTLHTPLNKGHESLAYLTYITTHYTSLPSILAFIHPHRGGYFHYRSSWHTDAPAFDNVLSLNTLRLDTVLREGYVNLRCNWHPGCVTSHRKNAHITPAIWEAIFPNGTEWGGSVDGNNNEEEEEEGGMPSEIGAACCAQFAVSREQVLKRPRADYERMREWVLGTGLSDARSGRVMEFLWHVVFGREAVQ
ncbi:MAG: hypothetical protein M1835_006696 [Candelina submexicana]|nr:MAG: hypothetical protein M1835_006696 [Candelina submexicana]